MQMIRLVDGVRSHFVYRMPEWMLSGLLGLLGMQFLRSNDIFANSKTYSFIAHFVSETVWGSCALAISLCWLVALFLNGTFIWFSRWSKWIRSLSAFAASGFWSLSALGIYEAAPQSPATINNAGYAVMAFIVSLITAREVGRADK